MRVRGKESGEREEERQRLSVACLCLMEVPGVALRLLHFTINGGSLKGEPCFSITPTHTHTHTHPVINLLVELNSAPEFCLNVSLVSRLQNHRLLLSVLEPCANTLSRLSELHTPEGARWLKMRKGEESEEGKREMPFPQNSGFIISSL